MMMNLARRILFCFYTLCGLFTFSHGVCDFRTNRNCRQQMKTQSSGWDRDGMCLCVFKFPFFVYAMYIYSFQKLVYFTCLGNCSILDPTCRSRITSRTGTDQPTFTSNKKCDYKQLWLIPGSADTTCGS